MEGENFLRNVLRSLYSTVVTLCVKPGGHLWEERVWDGMEHMVGLSAG